VIGRCETSETSAYRRPRVSEIAEAAGCSKALASDVKRGKETPHLSSWSALAESVAFSRKDDAR